MKIFFKDEEHDVSENDEMTEDNQADIEKDSKDNEHIEKTMLNEMRQKRMLWKEDKDNKVTDMRQTDDSRDMRNENERRTNESAKNIMYSDIRMKRCKNDVSDKTEQQ